MFEQPDWMRKLAEIFDNQNVEELAALFECIRGFAVYWDDETDETIEQMRGPFANDPRYDGLTEFPGLAEELVD